MPTAENKMESKEKPWWPPRRTEGRERRVDLCKQIPEAGKFLCPPDTGASLGCGSCLARQPLTEDGGYKGHGTGLVGTNYS